MLKMSVGFFRTQNSCGIKYFFKLQLIFSLEGLDVFTAIFTQKRVFINRLFINIIFKI